MDALFTDTYSKIVNEIIRISGINFGLTKLTSWKLSIIEWSDLNMGNKIVFLKEQSDLQDRLNVDTSNL